MEWFLLYSDMQYVLQMEAAGVDKTSLYECNENKTVKVIIILGTFCCKIMFIFLLTFSGFSSNIGSKIQWIAAWP